MRLNLRELFRHSLPHTLSAMTTRAAAWALALALVACGGSDGESPEPLADAGSNADSSGDSEPSCDEDGDGHLSLACGGDDCCDSDPDVHPGQEGFFDKPSKCGGWDYDCSGTVEKETELPVAECRREGIPGGGVGCYGYAFEGPAWHGTEAPGCGEAGTVIDACDSDCYPVKPTKRTQRCR